MSLFWLIFTLLNFSFAHQTEYDTWNDNFIWTPDSGPLPWMTKTISLPERREQIQMQGMLFFLVKINADKTRSMFCYFT